MMDVADGIAYGILKESVAALNRNGLSGPVQAAFDGERILGHNLFNHGGGKLARF